MINSRLFHRRGILLLLICALFAWQALPAAAQTQQKIVDMVVLPAAPTVNVGDTFTQTIRIEADVQPIDYAEVVMTFDPTIVQVLSVTKITPALSVVLVPEAFDNNAGTLTAGYGTFSDFPSGSIDFLEVEFEAIAAGSTAFSFSRDGFPATLATFAGENVLDETTGSTITVQDEVVNEAPTITLLGDNPLTLTVGDAYVEPGATASDAEDGDLTSQIVIDSSAVDTSVAGTYTVTYSVTDSGGLTTTEERTVIVEDPAVNEAPSITLLGDNPLTLTVGDVYIEPGATASDAEDGDLTSQIVIDSSAVDTSTAGTYIVTYSVTDSGGLTTTAERTVNVEEEVVNEAPTITLLGDNPLTLTVGDAYVEPGATASDAEDGDLTSQIVIDSSAVDTSVAGTYIVTYSVTDSGGLTTTAERTVIVEDPAVNEAPTITLLGDNPLTLTVGDVYVEPGATASDAEDGDLTSQIVIDSSAVDTSTAGTYIVIYSVTDSDGLTTIEERTVIVEDPAVNEAPTITLLGDNPLTLTVGDVYVEPGATASDAEDGDLTSQIVIDSSAVDTSIAGTYIVTYSVTDSGGLTTTEERTVNIEEEVADLAVTTLELWNAATDTYIRDLVPNDTVNLADTPDISIVAVTTPPTVGSVVFSVDGTQTQTENVAPYTIAGDSNGDLSVWNIGLGTVTVIAQPYSANQGGGDAGTPLSLTITIIDDTTVNAPPTITLLGDNPLTLTVGDAYIESGATASDAEDGDLTSLLVIDASAVDTSVAGTYIVTYSVTDSGGLTTTEERTVIVEDPAVNEAPTITLLGDNPLTLTVGDTYVEPGATASDAEDGDLTSQIVIDSSAVDTSVAGTYIVTYSVTDSGGLTTTAERTVIVEEAVVNEAPTITLLGDNPLKILVGSAYVEPGATASDAEDGDLTSQIVIDSSAVDTSMTGTYKVAYSVTDSGGLTTTVERTVLVKSKIPQVIGFTLYDASTGTVLGSTTPTNTTLTVDLAITPEITLVANTAGNINRIGFYLNGNFVESESKAPYSIGGDIGLNLVPWDIVPGTYIVKAVPSNNTVGANQMTLVVTASTQDADVPDGMKPPIDILPDTGDASGAIDVNPIMPNPHDDDTLPTIPGL